MSTSFDRHDERGQDRDEIASRRPPEPDEAPADPWATVRLEQTAPNGAGHTRTIPVEDFAFGPPPPELHPRARGADDAGPANPDAAGQPAEADPWFPAGDPWIDVTPRTKDPASATPLSRGRRTGLAVGLVAGGALVGALLVGAYTSWSSNASPSALTGQNGTTQNGQVQPGAPGGDSQPGQGGQGFGAGPGFGGGPGSGGGANGEQHIFGTVTAVSSSRLGVKSSSGTATYTIVTDTRIIRDGRLASASDLRVGDLVLVHVFPATNSDGVLERVIARSGSTASRSSTGTSSSDDGSTT